MKTTFFHLGRTLAVCALILSGAASAFADDAATTGLKTASGTITTVDAKDKVLKVRGFMFSKTFVLGDNCSLALVDRKATSLGNFQPGQQVNVGYKNVEGVLVAVQIIEQRLAFTGKVSSLDPASHSLAVTSGGNTRVFKLPDSFNVVVSNDKKGVLDDVKLGSRVTVIYETPNGQWTAARIEQTSLQFTGTLGAVNLSARTISAGKKLLGDKNFHLAADCAIVSNGKTDGRLQDLRIGDNYELSYTTVDGVNIVNRIAPASVTDPAATGKSANLNQISPAY